MLKYLVFLLFNLGYKDGNSKEEDMPDVGTAAILMGYQFFPLVIGIFFVDKCVDLAFITNILKPLNNIVYGWGMLMCLIMYPINHYFFVKGGLLYRIYNEFKNASINTKRNRIIGYTLLIIYWPIMIGVVGHLKYWFP